MFSSLQAESVSHSVAFREDVFWLYEPPLWGSDITIKIIRVKPQHPGEAPPPKRIEYVI